MAKTFDENLSTDKDWVRFLIGDSVATMSLEDETIEAVLAVTTLYPNKYLAAAECARSILSLGKDVVSKKVDELQIDYGGGQAESFYRERIKQLQAQGADQQMPTPRNFQVL